MTIQFNIYLILVGIGFIYGLVSLKKLTKPFKWVVALMGYVFMAELAVRYIIPNDYRISVYQLNVLVIIILNALIYLNLPPQTRFIKRFIVWAAPISFGLAVYTIVSYQGLNTFPSFGIAIQGLLSLALSLIFFNIMLKTPSQIGLFKQAVFWFNSGTLLFCGFTFVYYIFYNEFLGMPNYWLDYLNVLSNNLQYAFFIIALYMNQKATRGN